VKSRSTNGTRPQTYESENSVPKPEEDKDWTETDNNRPMPPAQPDPPGDFEDPLLNSNPGALPPVTEPIEGTGEFPLNPGSELNAPEPAAPAEEEKEDPFGVFKVQQPEAKGYTDVEVRKPEAEAEEKKEAPKADDKSAPVSTPEETDADKENNEQGFQPLNLETRLSLHAISTPQRTKISHSRKVTVKFPKLVRTKRAPQAAAKLVSR